MHSTGSVVWTVISVHHATLSADRTLYCFYDVEKADLSRIPLQLVAASLSMMRPNDARPYKIAEDLWHEADRDVHLGRYAMRLDHLVRSFGGQAYNGAHRVIPSASQLYLHRTPLLDTSKTV